MVASASPVWAERIEYQYDKLGSLSEIRFENGEKIVYSFDRTGNRSQVATISTENTAPVADAGADEAVALDTIVTLDNAPDTAAVGAGSAGTVPGALEGLDAAGKLQQISLLWEPVPSADNSRVFRHLPSEIDFAEIGQTDQRWFIDVLPTGVMSAKHFVVAINSTGESTPSATVVGTAGVPR